MEEETHDSGLGFRKLVLDERERAIQEIDTLALKWINFTDIKGKLRVAIQNHSGTIRIDASDLDDYGASAPFDYSSMGNDDPLREDRGMKALLRMVEMLDEEGMETTISLYDVRDEGNHPIEDYWELSRTDPMSDMDGFYWAKLSMITIRF